MSSPDAPLCEVILSQLAPDLRQAGIEFPGTRRPVPNRKALRALLQAAADLAPQIGYPLTPELRFTGAPGARGDYVIQIKDGRLNFVSWASLTSRGAASSVDQIVAIISGEVAEGDSGLPEALAPVAAGSRQRWKRPAIVALLILAVVGINAFTVIHAKRPPGNFLPRYTLLEQAPAERLLQTVAGDYETGGQPGDRRLQIARDGSVVWVKFGPDRSVAERKTFTVQGVEVAGVPCLLTSRQGLITIKDPLTVMLFGDTYLRAAK